MTSREMAEAISHIFSAPVVAALTFVVLIVLVKAPNPLILIMISLTFGTAVPLILLYFLSRKGIIPDLYASKRESRAIPFIGAILSYLLGAIFLLAAEAPPIVTAVMLCYLGNSLIMMLVTLKWKISIHTSGITGPATALAYFLGVWALLFFGLVIPVGWARIKLKAHNITQVTAGALLTIVVTWLQLGIYLRLLQSIRLA